MRTGAPIAYTTDSMQTMSINQSFSTVMQPFKCMPNKILWDFFSFK